MDIYAVTTQEILERISRHCPEAMSTYIQCLNRADDHGVVHFTEQMVDVDMSDDWSAFKQNIKKLARESLLEWSPLNNGVSVTLADNGE